ncbi:hypothetical protein F4780DRAFT_591236 [Xylariomycetidae sp. FL0641]|nr:hypothetical protein F4780DRAFT_591236 [Xylariomycetidae sp. FL0641]
MAVQLPVEVQGIAAAVLVYSFISEIAGFLLVWLVWVHRERTSYVACIAYFTLLSTTASIIQQFHVYVDWNSVITAQFHHTREHAGSPELVIANSSIGMDLVLFYIQYCCYNIEATLVLFWAFTLTQSVYGWSAKPHLRRTFKIMNRAGKVVSVVLPIILISLLQVGYIRRTFFGFLLVADILLIMSLAGGSGCCIAILYKYIRSRRQFKGWSVGYGKNSTGASMQASQTKGQRPPQQSRGIYDRWLLVRFTIAFVVLGVFEITNILFQLLARRNANIDALADKPDLSAARAQSTTVLFLPGVSPSLLAFIVFGTTKPFREFMYRTFIPKRFQRAPPEHSSKARLPYSSQASHAPSSLSRHQSIHVSSKAQEVDIRLANLDMSRTRPAQPDTMEDEWPILAAPTPRHGDNNV